MTWWLLISRSSLFDHPVQSLSDLLCLLHCGRSNMWIQKPWSWQIVPFWLLLPWNLEPIIRWSNSIKPMEDERSAGKPRNPSLANQGGKTCKWCHLGTPSPGLAIRGLWPCEWSQEREIEECPMLPEHEIMKNNKLLFFSHWVLSWSIKLQQRT